SERGEFVVEAAASAARVELRRKEVDRERAEREAELAEQALEATRTAHAAALLAEALQPGVPCPVCGSGGQPGSVRPGTAPALATAERVLEQARRQFVGAEATRAEASRETGARDEELRAATMRSEALRSALEAAEERVVRNLRADEVPSAVDEARSVHA